MKITPAEHARLRTYPHASRLFLGVQQGITILTGLVDGDHVEGATSIPLRDVVCDDVTDLIRGMTVAVGVPQNTDRRVSAVFLDYDDGTQTVTIGPNALRLDDGEHFVVYSSFKLWKLTPPAFTEQKFPPFAIMGSPRAGFVNQPLSFVGEFAYSPVGRALSAFSWKKFDADLVDGSLTAANTEAEPLLLAWDTAGEYLVRYKVTDDAGEVGVRYCPVLQFDRSGANAPYQEFTLSNFRWNGAGWSADVNIYGVAGADNFPNEALVVVWAEDWYGDTVQSIGGQYAGASDVVFCGYIRAGTTSIAAEENSIRFTMDSVEALTAALSMPDFTFREGDDVTDWHTFDGLTLDKALLHIVQQNTTLPLMADVFTALFGYQVGILDVPSAPLFSQLAQSILQACFGYIAGSRFNSLTFARHRNMLTAELRSYLNTASIQFTRDDWLDLKLFKDKLSETAQVILEGRLGDDTPVRGVYPSTGPSKNGAILTQSGYLFFDQAQADEMAQVLWRRDNRVLKSATLRLPNYRILEPAFEEYATLILLDGDNNAGTNWDNTMNGDTGREVLCSGASIEFGEGFITVTYEFAISVYGAQGRAWDMLDPVPTLQWQYGYGQGAVAIEAGELADSEGVAMTDSDSVALTDSI